MIQMIQPYNSLSLLPLLSLHMYEYMIWSTSFGPGKTSFTQLNLATQKDNISLLSLAPLCIYALIFLSVVSW